VLNGLRILIVEDEPMIALDLALAIVELDGRAVGPVETVSEALKLMDTVPVGAAILDANLADRDVTPLALDLVARSVPFVIYTGKGLPDTLAQSHPDLPVVMKPARPTRVLAALLQQVSPDHAPFRKSRLDGTD
jgi:DNA-binding NtrC family response regulator